MSKKIDPPLQPTSPPRRYHKGNVADDLRKVAEHILATESLEDITVRRLTKEVGVAPANFYNHFDHLDDLLLSIAVESLDQAVDRATAAWSDSATKVDGLTSAAIDFVSFCVKNRQLMRLMLSRRAHDDPDDDRRKAGSHSFRGIVRYIYGEDSEQGVSAPGCERYGAAIGYIALTYGFALVLAEGRFQLDLENEEELSRFVRNGILPFLDGSAAATLAAADGASSLAAEKPAPNLNAD